MRILVVEDEPRIAADIRGGLEAANYVVETVADGNEAWFKGETEDYDAIVLDLGLPKLDGLTVLRRLREAGIATPVLVLTARDGWRDKVEGIDAGADDYLAKPFQMEELLARLRAITRRAAGQASSLIKAGLLELDTRSQTATIDGRSLALTAMEYRLLAYLLLHRGRTMSQGELLEHIHAGDTDRDINAVEAIVARLRKKLGIPLIETHRGRGYCIPAEPS
ncbi:response regulator transcription factor [Rhodopseudomonas boonkerdii]|uniref:response regulator transcription factor n=1 Tax=Rhodopseudomonas boonkerdii TaxID=475937 RepID=UPI001E59C392|nr:response regulator [Rhodopseudomonas boonkerdii]UGV27299.1 response regulator transcription factor [Rhodopseudomonas boonkerdii]